LSKSVTHLIWANGKLLTLLKAHEMKVQIVSPLWLKACAKANEVLDEELYRPSNLESKLLAARGGPARGQKRKIDDASQLKIFENQHTK
jgi:hypothetical protein